MSDLSHPPKGPIPDDINHIITDLGQNPSLNQNPGFSGSFDEKKEDLDSPKTQDFDEFKSRHLQPVSPKEESLLKIPHYVREEAKGIRSDSELIHFWMGSKSQRTIEVYKSEVKRFCNFTKGLPLKDLSIPLLCSYGEMIQRSNLSRSSQALALASVKSLLSFGFQVGYLPSNLGVLLKLPKRHDQRLKKVVSEGEIFELVLTEKKKKKNDHESFEFLKLRDQLILRVFYSAGLRASELCALKVRDLLPDENGGLLSIQGKGDKHRYTPVNDRCYRELEKWKEYLASQGELADKSPLFPSYWGRGHLTRIQIYRIVKDAVKRAGLPEWFSPHCLRHSFATHAKKKGVDDRQLQRDMGHGSITTTQGYISPGQGKGASHFLDL